MSFTDENAAFEESISTRFDETYISTVSESESLDSFFKRPLQLASFAWTPLAPISLGGFNPFFRYFENPRVANRIANYHNLSATMCIKFMVNGNPFYFGRAIAVWSPLAKFNWFDVEDAVGPSDVFKNILRSQQPHIYIDPTESQGGCMEIPFFYPYNAMSIPDRGYSDMGNLFIRDLTTLKHANGATDPIQITVYGWCKDVHLSVPTSDQIALTPQSGSSDEYGEGVISDKAAVVQQVAGKLKNVPVIGSYARATEMAAKGVGQVAKAFGYSKPPDISTISNMQQTHYGHLSTASGTDSVQKFTYDPKSEVTIDPAVTGLPTVDEMSLKYLVEKESYLTSVTWTSADISNVRLAEFLVTPMLFNRYSATGGLFLTSMCHASVPFRKWRGNIKFRIQVVASKFHKGRLLVSWDPSYFKSQEEIIQYSKIVDISEDRDITFEVGWGQPEPYADVRNPDTVIPFRLRSSSYTDHDPATNGVLNIRVLNPMAVAVDASANNDVSINVFVSAGENFELFDPKPSLYANTFVRKYSPFEEQSGVLDPVQPTEESQDVLGTSVIDKSALIYHGDPVVSLRQIFSRYVPGYNIPLNYETVGPSVAGPQMSGAIVSALPPSYGYNPAADTYAANLSPFCFDGMNIIKWYSLAYMGYRGSLRHKIVGSATTPEGNPVSSTIVSYRKNDSYTSSRFLTYYADSNASVNTQAYQGISYHEMGAGAAFSCTNINPVVTVECPYIQPSRFCFTRNNDEYSDNGGIVHNPRLIVGLKVDQAGTDPDATSCTLHTMMCAGEDFSLHFHVGPPILYVLDPVYPLV